MKRSPAPVVSREGCAPGVSVPFQTGNSRMARAMIACRTRERGGNRENTRAKKAKARGSARPGVPLGDGAIGLRGGVRGEVDVFHRRNVAGPHLERTTRVTRLKQSCNAGPLTSLPRPLIVSYSAPKARMRRWK